MRRGVSSEGFPIVEAVIVILFEVTGWMIQEWDGEDVTLREHSWKSYVTCVRRRMLECGYFLVRLFLTIEEQKDDDGMKEDEM